MNDPREKASCFSSDVASIGHHVLMVEPRGDVFEADVDDPDVIVIGAVMLAKQGPGDYFFEDYVWCRFSPATARSIGERLIRLADEREHERTNRSKGSR